MKAILVGHGPSMLAEPMGEIIDTHDIVVRMKRCQETLKDPEHFGTKTHIVGGSLTIAGALRDIPADEYWVFVDSRHDNVEEADLDRMLPRLFAPKTVRWNKELCDGWDSMYRAARTPAQFDPAMATSQSCDALGERHLSQGFKALLYAAHYLPVKEIVLAGFDNMITGEFTWSITRGPSWKQYPKHRWDVEQAMLPTVEEHFGKKITYLLPEVK